MSKKITLLGSTGSIGTQSLDVIRAQGYEVFGLSAHSHVNKILQQIEEFHPRYVCMTDPDAARRLDAELSGRADAPRLLVGPEGLKQLVRAAISGDDTMNYNYFEGKGLDVNELISLADTMPFFSERRLILIEDSGFFKTSSEALAEYLPTMPDTTCIVFVEEAVDKRNKLYKKVKDLGHIAEMKRQDSAQLARWAATILAQNGRKITPSTMNLFLERVGDDMENIRMELEKLISYTMGSEVVTAEDVKVITTVQITNKIFDMVAAITAGKTKRAMDLYEDLLTLREPPMRILFLIARQFNQLLLARELQASGADRGTVASKLKVPPFVAGKLSSQAAAFTKEQLISYVRTCVDAEEAVKTGRMGDRLAVELLISQPRSSVR